MKFVLAIAAAAIASVAAYDEVTQCSFDEIVKLAPLLSDENLAVCQAASGDALGNNQWQMVPPSGYPTAEQRAGMCGSDACFSLIDALLALGPGDCMLTIGDTSINTKKLAEEFAPSCFA